MNRRAFLAGATAMTACSQTTQFPIIERDWKPHFADLDQGAILVDTAARRLAYWGPSNSEYREFPIGTPSASELTRLGRTRVVRRRKNPTWAPTPSMLRRNPDLPRFVPAGPDNPLGEFALYLGWKYYAIHGTNDPVTIGRPTTSGCFRMFSGHIRFLFNKVAIGTPVLVI